MPVGLILSPIILTSSPKKTVFADDVAAVKFFLVISFGRNPYNELIMRWIYSGVVPQHPPNIVTPFSAIIFISWLYSSGLIS